MAIGADKLALRQLVDNDLASATADHRADLIDLGISRKMIPMHDAWREGFGAIGARHALFERDHP